MASASRKGTAEVKVSGATARAATREGGGVEAEQAIFLRTADKSAPHSSPPSDHPLSIVSSCSPHHSSPPSPPIPPRLGFLPSQNFAPAMAKTKQGKKDVNSYTIGGTRPSRGSSSDVLLPLLGGQPTHDCHRSLALALPLLPASAAASKGKGVVRFPYSGPNVEHGDRIEQEKLPSYPCRNQR